MVHENYLEEEFNLLINNNSYAAKFLQEGLLSGVWYWDLEQPENEWMSPEFWQTFGIDPRSRGHSPREWQDIIFPEDLKSTLASFEAHLADPNQPHDQVVRYRHVDGSVVWIRCRGLGIRDETGRPIRMLGAHTDITQFKEAEMAAHAAWKAAEVATEELKSFSYSVSHDMKSPANTLELLLQELVLQNEGTLDAESRELIGMCTETVARMKSLIEYVLDYTRVISMAPEKSEVSMSKVVETVLDTLEAEITKSGVVLDVEPLPDVVAVPTQMDILMQNLISNAIRYGTSDRPAHVRIHSEIMPAGDMFRITVTDNGHGIPAENQDRIFKLFQRLHGHDEIPGSGIGLPLCKRIAVNHAGSIELVSQLKRGSAFSLCLPTEALA